MAESKNVYVPSGDLEISQWDRGSFLADLSRQYHGTYVLITTEGPFSGEARNCRLEHILTEPDGITLSLACDQDSETRYTIANPERITAHRNANGATELIDIVSLDGSVTHVWFGDAVERAEHTDLAA
jgi:hypothetical protein